MHFHDTTCKRKSEMAFTKTSFPSNLYYDGKISVEMGPCCAYYDNMYDLLALHKWFHKGYQNIL